MINKIGLMTAPLIFSGIVLSACANQGDGNSLATQQVQNGPAVATKKAGVTHTHPANECTNTVSHTHPNGGTAHKHRYSCKPNKKKPFMHTHPANKCTTSVRHSHPNGKGVHTHRYSCLSKKKS